MKIKDYKYTPDKITYTACYDGLEAKIIFEIENAKEVDDGND